MYAVIQTGGKQYRVKSGEQVKIELLAAEVGETVSFDRVLMLGEGEGVKVGAPFVAGASVKGEIIEQTRGLEARRCGLLRDSDPGHRYLAPAKHDQQPARNQ